MSACIKTMWSRTSLWCHNGYLTLMARSVTRLMMRAGVKRTASGEAAAAAAKKQKTTPLATYQQAQEHLRTHTARFVCTRPLSILLCLMQTY